MRFSPPFRSQLSDSSADSSTDSEETNQSVFHSQSAYKASNREHEPRSSAEFPQSPLDSSDANEESGRRTSTDPENGESARLRGEKKRKLSRDVADANMAPTTARKRIRIAQYRVLLDQTVQDNLAQPASLGSGLGHSQHGLSIWTAREKEILLDEVARHRNSPSYLADKIATKSEAEVHSYLFLLQKRLRELRSQGSKKAYYAARDIPAAYEVPQDCEEALNLAAHKLASRAEKDEAELEQMVHGSEWLIDEDAACNIDKRYEQHESMLAAQRLAQFFPGSSPMRDANPMTHLGHTQPDLPHLDAVTELLRPSMFLELSRYLFMNSAESDSWHNMDNIVGQCNGPSLFRSALGELYNLAVSFTRRLCQTAYFQAQTRLRTQDSQRKTCVSPLDVEAACRLLKFQPCRHEFWATAARRSRVEVYSQAGKYKVTGRQKSLFGMQSGWLLSYDEVERDLKYQVPDVASLTGSELEHDIADFDIEEILSDSDLFTEEDSNAEDDREERNQSDISEQFESDGQRSKRYRRLGMQAFLKSEERFLNALDEHASMTHSRDLWQILGYNVPTHAAKPSNANFYTPRLIPDIACENTDRSDRVRIESIWDEVVKHPPPEAFTSMERSGVTGRARRKVLCDKVWERLHHGRAAPAADFE